ncbi:MAG: NuoF family protein [Armatimonadota bacterium]|nr:NuoF family protein [Armatimonadota bacterium]MDR7520753.1 NuoF family protein [Armatimonadota bacterium]MDR7550040.1 NuoF family protein [Armatimonadota bacterium]
MTATIRIGTSTCGLAAGAEDTFRALRDTVSRLRVPATLVRTGCLGACHREPLVEITINGSSALYGPVSPAQVEALLQGHFGVGEAPRPPDEWVVSRSPDRRDYPFFAPQVKVTTSNCGVIDPLSLDAYLAVGGYEGLRRALVMTPDAVIAEIKESKLRGRGGAGYPTGVKWEICRGQPDPLKYLVCNADEGDPGAFMDRTVIEGDPHRVLEGMVIAAHAIGARWGYVYVRAEYPLAVRHLEAAVDQARDAGYLGTNILGCGLDFDVIVKEGAGAFVCGEETALMQSIEGRRGTPRMRPPYPAASGLWGHPTNINNVETYASIPDILTRGGAWFARLGTASSGGTKTFALTGAVRLTGLIEVPMGMTLRDVIFGIGGGIRDGRAFKAVQIGGPSGGCLPASLLDTPVDYEPLRATGAIMGSGGMVVADEGTCMVDLARYFLSFTQSESCGKCIPCRIGTRKMLGVLTGITRGEGKADDLERLERIAQTVRKASLCGLGLTAPNPVLTTLRYFRDEYETHIHDRRCPAGVCAALR